MERTSFLKAQPFLFPVESSSWPIPLAAETSERSSCRRELLLSEYHLSLELISSDSNDNEKQLSQKGTVPSGGPIFFCLPGAVTDDNTAAPKNSNDDDDNRKKDRFDPAMCVVELAVHSSNISLPAHFSHPSNRLTSPTIHQKHQHQPHGSESSLRRTQQSSNVCESTFYLNIEGQAYQLDLQQIENLDLQVGEKPTEDKQPPSLLIQMGNVCILRFFSMKADRQEHAAALQRVQALLLEILASEDHIASEFPFLPNSMASPGGSSTTVFSSIQEPGQREFRPALATTNRNETPSSMGSKVRGANSCSQEQIHPSNRGALSTLHGQPSSETEGALRTPNETSPEDPIQLLRKRRLVYTRTQDNWNVFGSLLMEAERLCGYGRVTNTKRLRSLRERANTIIRSIPNDLGESYAGAMNIRDALQFQKERMQQCERSMEDLVESFWPQSSTRKGPWGEQERRYNGSCTDRTIPSSHKECVDQANEILQKHQEILEEKLALSLLPIRGS